MPWLAADPPPGSDLTAWFWAVAAGIFLAVAAIAYFGAEPFRAYIRRREAYYDDVLRRQLLMDISPRTVTVAGLCGIALLAIIGYFVGNHILTGVLGALVGLYLPGALVKFVRFRRNYRLEDQLVDGVQTLTSGVRAGLNLTQSMELLAQTGVKPIAEEFGHLCREYEHGISIEKAMLNAADRIQSSNYRLLFSALLTHRERGGDLSETLERIADSIREIHRLEKRIETLTAPGRTAARWMSAMPAVILLIMNFIDPHGVALLFSEDMGRLILAVIVVLNIIGYLWIRRIVNIDI